MPTGTFRSDWFFDTTAPSNLVVSSLVYFPVGTRSVRLNLAGTRTSGTSLDCWWDEIQLKVYSGGAWSANLFVNPSAESAPGAEWSSAPARQQYSAASINRRPPFSYATNYFYYGAAAAASFSTYQDVNVSSYATDIDTGTCRVWFDGWFGSFGNDDYFTTMNIEFRQTHPGGTVLGTRTFNPTTNWKLEFGWPGFVQLGFGYDWNCSYGPNLSGGFDVLSTWYAPDEDILVKVGSR